MQIFVPGKKEDDLIGDQFKRTLDDWFTEVYYNDKSNDLEYKLDQAEIKIAELEKERDAWKNRYAGALAATQCPDDKPVWIIVDDLEQMD